MMRSFAATFRRTLFSVVCLCSTESFAQSLYITDIIQVSIRSGPGNEYRILHPGLKSGVKMALVEGPEDSDWTKVITEGGIEGWVRSQYLISEPTAELQLIDAQTKLSESNQQQVTLQTQLSELKTEHSTLSSSSLEQINERDQYADELKNLKILSSDAITLNEDHQELLVKYEAMSAEFNAVQLENTKLKSDTTINQWLFGAGILFTGMISMIILPALKPRKGSTDWGN